MSDRTASGLAACPRCGGPRERGRLGPARRTIGETLGWLPDTAPPSKPVDLLTEVRGGNRLIIMSFAPVMSGWRCPTCRALDLQY